MKNLYQKYKLYIIGALLIGVLFVLYSLFFPNGGDDSLLSSETTGRAGAGVEQELLSTLVELRTIRLDDSVFSNPAFRSLEDFSVPLTPEPVGRDNPFAPIGSAASGE